MDRRPGDNIDGLSALMGMTVAIGARLTTYCHRSDRGITDAIGTEQPDQVGAGLRDRVAALEPRRHPDQRRPAALPTRAARPARGCPTAPSRLTVSVPNSAALILA